jgi:ankyrin repeat protein
MRQGWIKIASMLLEANVPVTIRNQSGLTALHIACKHAKGRSSPDPVKLLLEAHAEVDVPDDSGKTPLYYAAVPPDSNAPITLALLNAGAKFSWDSDIGKAIRKRRYRYNRRMITIVIKRWQKERLREVARKTKMERRRSGDSTGERVNDDDRESLTSEGSVSDVSCSTFSGGITISDMSVGD